MTTLLDPALVQQLGRLVRGARRTALGPGGGLHRSPFKGAGIDFRQHRTYVPGDDVRRLDWRVLARTDRAFVREYDDETTLRTLLVVDASGSMRYGNPVRKIDDAARLAAALAYVSLAAGENAGLIVAREGADLWVPPSGAATQLARVVDTLGGIVPAGPTALDSALIAAASRTGRRALVMILSDLMLPPDRLRHGLARLHHGHHDVVVIRVLHNDEVDFPFRGYVQFVGLEREATATVSPAVARPAYLARLARHTRQVREVCRATHTEFVDHPVGRPLIDTVRGVVRRGRA